MKRVTNRVNMKALTLLFGNIPFENKTQPLGLQWVGFKNIKIESLNVNDNNYNSV